MLVFTSMTVMILNQKLPELNQINSGRSFDNRNIFHENTQKVLLIREKIILKKPQADL